MSCGSPQLATNSGTPKAPSLTIAVNGNDLTQTYTYGSTFTVKLEAVSNEADTLGWHIADYAGDSLVLNYISVQKGTTTATITCSSTRVGYFTVSANLKNSGATQPQVGSRPAGFVTFGVLPNVSDLLPASAKTLDQHRIGLQGANYVESGVCCSGPGLQPVNENLGSTWVLDARNQALTEPNNSGQYKPQNYPIDPSLKQGTLARIVTLNGIPAWASTAPSANANGSYPPKSFSAYQAYTALVGLESTLIHAQYIPNQQKNYYQVTWEPDPGPATQWMGTDAQFVQLYQAAYNGVHSTDPDAAVMGPATQGIPTCAAWLTRLAPLGLTKYLDAVACHGYYALGSSSDIPPEPAGLPSQVQNLRKVMASLLPAGTKLFVTETGISYPMGTQYSATYPTWDVLTQHAEAVVRTHLIMLGEGVDTSFLFYSADFKEDVGFGLYFNLSMATNDFNSPNIAPKPAAMAVAAATRLIDGSRSLGAINNLPTNGYGYSFLLSDQAHTMTALWAHDGTYNASIPYQLKVDAAGTSGTVVVFDTMGNPSKVPYTNGLAQVTLSEMPIYVMSSNVGVLQAQTRAPEGYSTQF
ncbi:MAG TPA: hypothetical protein VHY75_00780 [Steroidobacteraceae bacterium]|jgi:hypothetical protein|nr:hypothetical protein [Steroidobacteraceae bacterium]